MNMKWIDFFISYSPSDKVIVKKIVEQLKSAGATCRYAPTNLTNRALIDSVDKMRHAKIFLLCLSKSSATSKHVLFQTEMAFKRKYFNEDLLIEPLCIESIDLDAPEFHEIMRYIHGTNFIFPTDLSSAEKTADEIISKNSELRRYLIRKDPLLYDGTRARKSRPLYSFENKARKKKFHIKPSGKDLAEALKSGRSVVVASNGQAIIGDTTNSDTNSGGLNITVPPAKLAGGILNRCRFCDNEIPLGAKFCPWCGRKIEIEKPVLQLSQVEFSAIAPKQLAKGEYFIIDIVMYEESYRHIVDELQNQAETETQEKKSGKVNVKEDSNIKVILYSPNDIKIEDNEMTGVWQNSYLNFSFPVYLPRNYSEKQILFTAKVYINGVIATRLTFTAKCSSSFEQKMDTKREDVLTAFISYASEDRKTVATIIQGMQKARPDLDLFFDVESLRSGDNWKEKLYHAIDQRDILYLCWSHYAKESKWVDREWRYAYKQKGIDAIEPIPLELPENCPPPEELEKKHFNNILLYITSYSNSESHEKN